MMLLMIILVLVFGATAIGFGVFLLFGKKKSRSDARVFSRPGTVIKIVPSPSSSLFPPGVGRSLDPDYIMMGDIFNTQGAEPDSNGEIELMTRLSSAFRDGRVSPSLVKLAEERINLFINNDIWDLYGGRAAVMDVDRDAHLASLRYTEFIQALKRILYESNSTSNITYLDDYDRSYDNLCSEPEEIRLHEDFGCIEHSEIISAMPVERFEVNFDESIQSEIMSGKEDGKEDIREAVNSNISRGGHLGKIWDFLGE